MNEKDLFKNLEEFDPEMGRTLKRDITKIRRYIRSINVIAAVTIEEDYRIKVVCDNHSPLWVNRFKDAIWKQTLLERDVYVICRYSEDYLEQVQGIFNANFPGKGYTFENQKDNVSYNAPWRKVDKALEKGYIFD